jgi:hypothetical protein
MKFLVVISILALSVYMCAGSHSDAVCAWQQARNELVSQLTPEGQETLTEIAESQQLITGAAIQPLFESLGEKYAEQLKAINASADSDKLEALGQLLGIGDYFCGEGPLVDECEWSKEIEALVSSFSEENQQVIGNILEEIHGGVAAALKSLFAINYVLNHDLLEKLAETEDPTVLEKLAQHYGQ